jgi:hypothetical protein
VESFKKVLRKIKLKETDQKNRKLWQGKGRDVPNNAYTCKFI